MDFFGHQEVAKRNSRLLIPLFSVGILITSVSVFAGTLLTVHVVIPMLNFLFVEISLPVRIPAALLSHSVELALIISISFALFIFLEGLRKLAAIRQGGGFAIAELLQARALNTAGNSSERRLLNVTQEMAIASGVAMPHVFVLDQLGINAFVAGSAPENTVMVITTGAMDMLSRDELQAVVAHEFSHILHGDLSTNMRMLGLLHGINLVAEVCSKTLFAPFKVAKFFFPKENRRLSIRARGLIVIVIVIYALYFLAMKSAYIYGLLPLFVAVGSLAYTTMIISVFVVMGSIFLLLINLASLATVDLIKSAISRQREYLADASAVQFTRNPEAIVSVLKFIGGYQNGSKLQGARVQELSHFFFAAVLHSWRNKWSTHPPVLYRIQKIDPNFQGEITPVSKESLRLRNEAVIRNFSDPEADETNQLSEGEAITQHASDSKQDTKRLWHEKEVIASIGAPTAAHLKKASQLMQTIPEAVKNKIGDAHQAQALICLLLLSRNREVSDKQIQAIQSVEPKLLPSLAALRNVLPAGQKLDHLRLPLLDLVTPALQQLDTQAQKRFLQLIRELINADNVVSIYECLLFEHLLLHFRQEEESASERPGTTELKHAAAIILALACRLGQHKSRSAIWSEGMAMFYPDEMDRMPHIPEDGNEGMALNKKLSLWQRCEPSRKKLLLQAVVHCVLADGNVSEEELQILRLISMALGCPMPLISAA